MSIPAAGQPAPDFAAPTDADTILRLADLRGRWVILFFYPKDDTSTWTIEATGFRDALPRFEGADAVVIGVSPDDAKKHRKFKKKYDLPYTLVADTDHAVADAYGVWQEKSMFGRKYFGIVRTTFLIAPDGRIARVFTSVDAEGHATEVLGALAALRR